MKGFSLVFLAACIAYVTANSAVIEPLVVGGRKAELGQFPHQVSLRSVLLRSHFCGGSIISKRFILTAAHCTTGLNLHPTFFVAVVGAVKSHFDGVTYRINKVMRHEDFSLQTISNDISLLRTAKEITFTANIQPIALPKQNDPGNTAAVVSGWGKTTPRAIFPASSLQYAQMTTLNYQECAKKLEGTGVKSFLKSYNVCALNKLGVGACFGDSGGPLADAKNRVIIGIASWITKSCAAGFPDTYTGVYPYLGWIKKQMQQSLDN